MGDAEITKLGRIGRSFGGDLVCPDSEVPACRRHDPGQHIQQLRLAVARHPGDADDLALAQRHADLLQLVDPGRIRQAQILNIKNRRAGPCRRVVDLEQHLAPDHQLGQFGRRGVRRLQMGDHLAAAHHRHIIGDRHDLLELVGDQQNGDALLAKRAQDIEQLLGFLRRQDTCRLVEDQDFGTAKQRFQDFHTLLQPDRKVLDDHVRIDRQAEILRQLVQRLTGLARAGLDAQAAFAAKHDIFQNGEIGHQHEMLMHHADPLADGIGRIADGGGLAIDPDGAAVGAVKAVKNADEGGFAGTVLADNPVDMARHDCQADVPVRVNVTKTLVDIG